MLKIKNGKMYNGTEVVQLEMLNKEQIDCYKNCCERENEFKEGIVVSIIEEEDGEGDKFNEIFFECICGSGISVTDYEFKDASDYDKEKVKCAECSQFYLMEEERSFELLIRML